MRCLRGTREATYDIGCVFDEIQACFTGHLRKDVAFVFGCAGMFRTTYMFAYMDADPRRMSLESMMDDYWDLLPT